MKKKLNFITKSLLVKTFVILMIIGMLDSAVFSQTRVRFARGKSSATVSGKLSGGYQRTYIVGARAGQMMTIRLQTAGNVWFDIGGGEPEDASVTIECDSTDDYEITVHNEDDYTNQYSLFIAIN